MVSLDQDREAAVPGHGRWLFYAVATFLLGLIAVSTSELALNVTTSHEDFFKILQSVAAFFALFGPFAFVVDRLARAFVQPSPHWIDVVALLVVFFVGLLAAGYLFWGFIA